MALLGEMFEFIVHQSRQPLSLILTISSTSQLKNNLSILTKEELDKNFELISESVNHLSSSIDDFRNFINPNKIKREFQISNSINKSLNFLQKRLKDNSINIVKEIGIQSMIGVENELTQVLMCIINNAIDELKKADKRYLKITLTNDKDNYIIKIKDSAGGIKNSYIDKVFKIYCTTKEKKGTGIGLYMSKKIIQESFNGEIVASNKEYIHNYELLKGAEFKIILPIKKEV